MNSFLSAKGFCLLVILAAGFGQPFSVSAQEDKLAHYSEELKQIEIDLKRLTLQIRSAYQKKQKDKAKELSQIRDNTQKRRKVLKKLQYAERKAQKQAEKNAKRRQNWEKLPAYQKLCKAISYDRLDWLKEAVEVHAIDLTKNGPMSVSCGFLVGSAAAANRLDITEYLLKNNAPLISDSGLGPPTPALWLAANTKKDRTAIINLLFKYGASVTNGSSQGIGSELISASGEEAQEDLEKRRNIKASQLVHGDMLARIIKKGHINNIRLFLDRGADPNGFNMGSSVLTDAATKLRIDVVKLLVNKGASVNLQGPNFETAYTKLQQKQVRGKRAEKSKAMILGFLRSHGAKEKSNRKE